MSSYFWFEVLAPWVAVGVLVVLAFGVPGKKTHAAAISRMNSAITGLVWLVVSFGFGSGLIEAIFVDLRMSPLSVVLVSVASNGGVLFMIN